MHQGPWIAKESFDAAPRGASTCGRAPRASPAPDRCGIFCPVRARVASRVLPCPAPPNETLQLPGDRLKEIVVDAALAPSVNQHHLPSEQVARS